MAPRLFGFLYFEKFPQITPPKIRLRRTLLGPSAFMVSTKFCKCLQKHPQIFSNFLIRSLSPRLRISTNFLIRSLSPVSGFPQISSKSSKFPHQNPVPSSQDFHKFLQKHLHISPAAAFPCPLVLEFPQISSKTSPNFACGRLSPVPLVLGFPQISSKSPQKIFACGGRPHVLKNDPETRSIKKNYRLYELILS